MIYRIYYVVYNIEYIVYSTCVSTTMARTRPRMLSKRMLVLKFSRAPPPPSGGCGHLGLIAGGGADHPTPSESSGSGQRPTHLSKQLCLLSIQGFGYVIWYVIYCKKLQIISLWYIVYTADCLYNTVCGV